MRIVLLGAPGSGKGTQAKLIAKAYEAPHVPMNDLLRAAVAADTPFGRQARATTEAGQPITDEVMLGIVQERLSQQDARAKFILEGFPRNLSQAEALDALLEQHGQPLQAVILIDVDFETLLQRFTGRRTCVSCGKTYNIYTSPSRLDDRCDECGGNLRHRADEKEETISNRLRVYETQTAPLIEHYRRKGLLRVVSGAGEIDDIFKEITKVLDSLALEEKAAAEKQVAPAKKEAREEAGKKVTTLTRAAKAALTAAEEEIKTITEAARSVEKKAVRTAKKIVRAAEKEARVATKAVHTLKKKALQTTKKLLKKAEKAVEKKKVGTTAKPPAAKKAPPAKKVVAKAVVKKVAVKKIAVKAAPTPKKPLKSVVVKKGTVKKTAAGKKAAPAKALQKAAEKRR